MRYNHSSLLSTGLDDQRKERVFDPLTISYILNGYTNSYSPSTPSVDKGLCPLPARPKEV